MVEFNYRRFPGGVGYSPMKGGDSAAIESGASDREVMLLKHGHSLIRGGIHVE